MLSHVQAVQRDMTRPTRSTAIVYILSSSCQLYHGCHMSSWGAVDLPLLQVDQLLEYHFEEDMTRLTQHCGKKLPTGRQTIIVSATLKDKVLLCLADFLSNKQYTS